MKAKFGCDLRGDAGMKAAFGGSKADELDPKKISKENPGKGMGIAMKFKASCDRADRVKDTLKKENGKCPCAPAALMELSECIDAKASDVFDGSCSDAKLTPAILKKQFPNCATEMGKALAKKKMKKVIKSKFQMKMKGISKEDVQDMKQNEDVMLSMQKSIAKQYDGIETEDVTIL